jgi:Fe-S-cluster-containing hydrogenase component 2
MELIDKKRFLCVNLAKCTGCRSCELACSFHFSEMFAPEASAIKVVRDNDNGDINLHINSRCDLCQGEYFPLCVKYCAAEALNFLNNN